MFYNKAKPFCCISNQLKSKLSTMFNSKHLSHTNDDKSIKFLTEISFVHKFQETVTNLAAFIFFFFLCFT